MPSIKKKSHDVIDITEESWQSMRDQLYLLVDDLSDCAGIEFIQEAQVHEIMQECVGDTLDVNRFQIDQEQAQALIARIFDQRMYLKLPQQSLDLFKPINVLDPEQDCFNLKLVEDVSEIISQVATACWQCNLDVSEDEP